MRIFYSSSSAIGIAIGLALGSGSVAIAQQKTDTTSHAKSSPTKIPVKTAPTPAHIQISKEGGEVVPTTPAPNKDSAAAAQKSRQDSIAAAAGRARQDSIARMEQLRRDSIAFLERRRKDSIAVVERARRDSIARADSIAAAVAAERARISHMRNHGGFYFGVGFGASIPTGSMTNSGFNSGGYSTGWNVTVPIGYDIPHSPLGFRLDGTFDQLNGRNFNSNFSAPNLDAWSVNLDARLRVPLGRTFSRFYMLGGATYSGMSGWFTDFSNPDAPTSKQGTQGDWGWNAGGGFNFNWGSMVGMFVESRYVWVNQSSVSGFPFTHAAWVPIVLGVVF